MVDVPIYDSAHRPPPVIDEFVQAWRYWDLVIQLVRRDIVSRYKRSVLGVAWTMLNPLGMMIIMTVVFSQLFNSTRAYPAYLLVALVAWNFFSQTTVFAMRQLVWGSAIIQRIYMPKTLFAIAAVGTGLVNLLFAMIPLTLVLLVTGVYPQWPAFFLPVAILLLVAFTLGIGLMLSAIVVYFPDVAEMYEIVISAWMYLTPIFYPESIIPASYRWWFTNLNPMYHLINLFRLPLYQGVWPSPEQVAVAALIAFGAFAIGWTVFTRRADDFAYRV